MAELPVAARGKVASHTDGKAGFGASNQGGCNLAIVQKPFDGADYPAKALPGTERVKAKATRLKAGKAAALAEILG
jgi:hypothetical protein